MDEDLKELLNSIEWRLRHIDKHFILKSRLMGVHETTYGPVLMVNDAHGSPSFIKRLQMTGETVKIAGRFYGFKE